MLQGDTDITISLFLFPPASFLVGPSLAPGSAVTSIWMGALQGRAGPAPSLAFRGCLACPQGGGEGAERPGISGC